MNLIQSMKGGFASMRRKLRKLNFIASRTSFPNAKQFRKTALPQEFSFPMPVMKYIWENPSKPNVYQKLIKCCKFFFIKNSILVVETMSYGFNDVWDCSSAFECICGTSCKYENKKPNIKKIKDKIWISKEFNIITWDKCSNVLSTIIPKIYQCDFEFLKLINQIMLYDELKFFTNAVKECFFACCTVKGDNGEEVPLENILKLFGGTKKFYMNFAFQSHNAACKNYDDFVGACNSIKKVKLDGITAAFDVPTFYQHLKRSKNRSVIKIFTDSNNNRIRETVKEILETESFEFVPPLIKFVGDNETWVTKMKEIQANEAAKYC